MSISALVATELTPTDSAPAIAGLSAQKLVFDSYRTSASLHATSTPAITKKAMFLGTIGGGGSATIDLTALSDAAGTQDFSGLKVQAIKIQNLGANKMTFGKGASNGLGLCTDDSAWTIPLPPVLANAPYPEFTLVIPEGTPDVAGGDKIIDVTGTAGQQFTVTLLGG